MTYTGIKGSSYQIEPTELKSGGEGAIYRVYGGTSKKVAKIYKASKLTQELESKLKYMIGNPPEPSMLNQVAWPLDVLYDAGGKFCGFVMPELSINAVLKDIYQYPPNVGLTARDKVTIAGNICAVISAVHNAGYVFGDFNPQNIGVDKNSGRVAFLDTDSYHVFDNAKNRYYRCKVCADGYAAPELLETCADHAANYSNDSKRLYEKTPLPTFTRETDNFALAIHIYKLLSNGFTPFGGIIEAVTASQPLPGIGNAAIRRNEYSFRPGYKSISPAVPPLDVFPQEIADLFTRAFLVVGSVNPSQRPTAIEWYEALSRYENTLVDCPKNKLHQYDGKNGMCPFCEADARFQKSIGGGTGAKPSRSVFPQQKTYSNTPLTPPRSMGTSLRSASPNFTWSFKKILLVAGAVIVALMFFWGNFGGRRTTPRPSPQQQISVSPIPPHQSPTNMDLELVGTWVFDSGSRLIRVNGQMVRPVTRLEFFRDGTGIADGFSFTWRSQNNRNTIRYTLDGATHSFNYSVSGSWLTHILDTGERVIYRRVNSTVDAPQNNIITQQTVAVPAWAQGTWGQNRGAIITPTQMILSLPGFGRTFLYATKVMDDLIIFEGHYYRDGISIFMNFIIQRTNSPDRLVFDMSVEDQETIIRVLERWVAPETEDAEDRVTISQPTSILPSQSRQTQLQSSSPALPPLMSRVVYFSEANQGMNGTRFVNYNDYSVFVHFLQGSSTLERVVGLHGRNVPGAMRGYTAWHPVSNIRIVRVRLQTENW